MSTPSFERIVKRTGLTGIATQSLSRGSEDAGTCCLSQSAISLQRPKTRPSKAGGLRLRSRRALRRSDHPLKVEVPLSPQFEPLSLAEDKWAGHILEIDNLQRVPNAGCDPASRLGRDIPSKQH